MVATQRVEEAEDRMLAITAELRVLQSNITISERKLKEIQGQRAKDSVYRSRLSVIDQAGTAQCDPQALQSVAQVVDASRVQFSRQFLPYLQCRGGA